MRSLGWWTERIDHDNMAHIYTGSIPTEVGVIYKRAYSAHILKCVNTHDALVAALRGLLHEFGDKATNANVRAAREVLAMIGE